MLHELLTIKNNYIYFEKSANLKENENEFVISCIHDDFYKKNMFANFGELEMNIKEEIQKLSMQKQQNVQIQSIGCQ